MGPGSLLASSQAEAQTYLSPAGRQRPQPQAPGAQKGMHLLGLQEPVSKQDRTAWPRGGPQSQGKAGPEGAGLDQPGPQRQEGSRKRDAGLCGRFSLGKVAHVRRMETASLSGKQPPGQPGLRTQALVAVRGPDSAPPSINTVRWVLQCPRSLRIWPLCWHRVT